MTLSWPTHLLTLDDWEALPSDELLRLELVEGVLQMSAKPFLRHRRAAVQLAARLNELLPASLIPFADVEVVVFDQPHLTIRVPDVVVAATASYHHEAARLAAADVRLAVEILSDGTRRVDRIVKHAEYAEAGIEQYWVIDVDDPVTLSAHVLVEDHYERSAEYTGRAELDVAGHPVVLDLAALTPR